jgi:hypothetical protein
MKVRPAASRPSLGGSRLGSSVAGIGGPASDGEKGVRWGEASRILLEPEADCHSIRTPAG